MATSGGVPGPPAGADRRRLTTFAVVFTLSRRVSVGSLAAAVACRWQPGSQVCRDLAWRWRSCWGVVVARHIPNIKRLWRGEEPPLFRASRESQTFMKEKLRFWAPAVGAPPWPIIWRAMATGRFVGSFTDGGDAAGTGAPPAHVGGARVGARACR